MATIGRMLPNFKIRLDGTIVNCFINKISQVPIQKAQINQVKNSKRCRQSLCSSLPLASTRPFSIVSRASSVSPISSVSLPPSLSLESSLSLMSIRSSSIRSFHTSPIHGAENQDKKGVRKVIHMQNPMQWLRVWADFRDLNNTWDSSIDRNGFIEGAKMAVSRISQLICQNSYSELRGLLSRAEYKRLQAELEKSWSDVQRRHVGLDVENIHNVVVTRLRKQQIVEQKFCDIDVYCLCLKDVEEGRGPILIKIFVRFHRDYTQGRLPDWIVTRFAVKFDNKFAGLV